MWPFRNIEDAFVTAEQAAGEYDYIVVGGGTAGCVLARRLSEHKLTTVLLLERGSAAENFASRNPLFSQHWAFGAAQSFVDKSTGSPIMDGREQEIVGGRALGGGSRINGMMYARGVSGEFNEWVTEGRTGWAYDDIETFFRKTQNCLDPTVESYQGHQGPLTTKRISAIRFGSSQQTKDAALRLGIPNVIDANSPDESAVGITHIHQIITEQGQRNSAYHAFLPLQYRQTHPNLTICTSALARKLDVSTTEGQVCASGVFFQAVDGKSVYHAKARKEVVLSCGAIFSPQLLMLSGIGPKEHLEAMGIPVQKDLPGVGSSIQDHMGLSVDHTIPIADSWYGLIKRPWMFIIALFMYLFLGTGDFTVPQVEVATFMRSELIDNEGNYTAPQGKQNPRDPDNCPDFEIMVIPNGDPFRPGFDRSKGCLAYLISILRPQSTGTLRLKSSDPSEFPALDLGFMSDSKDYKICRSALRLAMRLGQEVKKTGYLIEPFSAPKSFEDADLDEFTRQYGRSIYHYCASCRMAPEEDSPRAGVVDNELRVHGVQGLRIADSSVFPRAPSAHPMAPVMMVAEKCADMLLKVYKS